jgi:hypothetical protein
MSRRQEIMALALAAILLTVVIATAAKPQNSALSASQVEVQIEPPAPEVLLSSRSNMTTRAKTPLQRPSPPPYENRDEGAVWGQAPTYDLTRTSQASIYIFYAPSPND